MTLPSNSRVSTKYTANGTNKDFAYNFRVFYSSDTGTYGIEVRKVVEGGYEIVSPALYEVIPDDSTLIGGKIRYFTAPDAGTELYVAGKTPKVQQLNLANYGRFSAESIEANFDFMMAIIQEWLSSLDEERAQRIANDLLVNENTAALYANWQSWAETNVPVFAETFLTAELAGFKQQWIDALNQITLTSIPAVSVPTANGQNQQEINDSIGAKWYAKAGGYAVNDRVALNNGDVVVSTVPNNIFNPNIDMTEWVKTNDASQIKDTTNNQSVQDFIDSYEWVRFAKGMQVSPIQWGADPTGATDSSAAFQAWADHLSALTLSATFPPVGCIPAGAYTINGQVVLRNLSNCTIFSLGALISGISANPLDALFKINNAVNTKITGSLTISCNNLENYGSAFKVTASSGSPIDPNGIVSHCDFFGITVERAKVGYQLGEDLDNWDKHVAELHFVGCESRFVQIALANYGSQTEASFDGSTLAVGYLNAAHTDREYRIMKVKGGIIEYTGGSLINSMIPSNWTNSAALDIKPCKSAIYGNPYPVVSIVNPHIELTSKLLVVSSDFVGADSSFSNINFSGCKGWIGLGAAEDFINVYDASYSGKISIDETNNFYTSLGARTGKNINCASVGTILEVKPSAFGKNFVQGFAGIVGGILKHPLKLISQTIGLNASLATGKQPLVFTTANGSGDLARYSIYNTTNGNIQFPHKVKSINIKINIVDSGINVAGDIFIEKNGVLVCYANKSTLFATIDYTDNEVLSTDVYRVYFNKTGAVALNSASVSNISIFAET